MRKTQVKKLKKNQIVLCGGYEWKFHSSCGYVNGIGGDSINRIDAGDYDGYKIWLKAIDGKAYSMYGKYKPKVSTLDKQYWMGIFVDHKEIELKEE